MRRAECAVGVEPPRSVVREREGPESAHYALFGQASAAGRRRSGAEVEGVGSGEITMTTENVADWAQRSHAGFRRVSLRCGTSLAKLGPAIDRNERGGHFCARETPKRSARFNGRSWLRQSSSTARNSSGW
jgi:hypothetical protein